MSEYCFCLGPGHLPKRANAIARKHGAYLANYTEPRGDLGESWKQHIQDNGGKGPYNPLVIAECLRPGLWRVWVVETGE